MSIAFLIPTPPPVLPRADAYVQEIEALRACFGGRVYHINPNRFLPRHLPVQIPRPFFGLAGLPLLRRAGKRHSIFQIYSPNLYPYPVLRLLPRPVVYNLTGSAESDRIDAPFFNALAAVTVPDSETLNRLRAAGVANARMVRAGVDTGRFTHQPAPLGEQIRLIMASAPWTREQFRTKGVDALLDAARAEPRLHLTLLWRGVLTEEVTRRIRLRGLGERVSVIDQLVDVNELLGSAHAVINLATRGDIVKAFPHSLLESLVAGKPVLVSQAIPMASYVAANRLGVVVGEVSAAAILGALRVLENDYPVLQQRALEAGARDFGINAMLSSFEEVYVELCSYNPGKVPANQNQAVRCM